LTAFIIFQVRARYFAAIDDARRKSWMKESIYSDLTLSMPLKSSNLPTNGENRPANSRLARNGTLEQGTKMVRQLLQLMWTRTDSWISAVPRRRTVKVPGFSHEALEDRRLLSATAGLDPAMISGDAGAQVSEQQHVTARQQRKAAADLPDMNGTWHITVHYDGFDLDATLVLTQRGKKVTGTWQNEGQPPGNFKGKFVNAKQVNALGRAKSGQKELKAKTQNPAQVSPPKTVNVRAVVVAGLIDGAVGTDKVGTAVFSGTKIPGI